MQCIADAGFVCVPRCFVDFPADGHRSIGKAQHDDVGKGALAMVMLAVPGMIFTSIMAPIMTAVFKKVVSMATHSAPRKVV